MLLDEVRTMQLSGVRTHLLAAMAHGIEVCGALLDDRPFKAKGLGRTRFQLALTRLFPKDYTVAIQTVDLYGQLRSHLSHGLLPGPKVMLTDDAHLIVREGVMQLALAQFFHDYERAVSKLLEMSEADQIPEKRIRTTD